MNVRLERLKADQEFLLQMLTKSDSIRVAEQIGKPPDRYEIEFTVKGFSQEPRSGKIIQTDHFRVEITLTEGYPRLAPKCRMMTPVFHPNISEAAICVTDYWSADSSLARLVVRISELLAFQSYGLKYPLNPQAASWVEKNLAKLPSDKRDFVSLIRQTEGVIRETEEDIHPTDTCIGCGVAHKDRPLSITNKQQLICESCALHCCAYGVALSPKGHKKECQACGESACYSCVHKCLGCGTLVCTGHMTKCNICNLGHCPECVVQCGNCDSVVCTEHAGTAVLEDGQIVLCEVCMRQAH